MSRTSWGRGHLRRYVVEIDEASYEEFRALRRRAFGTCKLRPYRTTRCPAVREAQIVATGKQKRVPSAIGPTN